MPRAVVSTLARLGVLAAALTACSDRLELGHDVPSTGRSASPDGELPVSKPSAVTGGEATCEGAPCFQGPVRELGRVDGNARSVAVDAFNVYWAAPTEHALLITPLEEGDTVRVPAPAGGPSRVAVDPNFVFFSGFTGGYIAAVSKSSHQLSLLITQEGAPRELAVRSAVFFHDPQAGTISRAGYDATDPEMVRTGQAVELLAKGVGARVELAVDARGTLHFSDEVAGVVSSIQGRSGSLSVAAERLSRPGALLPRGDYLYFIEQGSEGASTGDGSLDRVPLAGGQVERLVTSIAGTSLAADATNVYVATHSVDGTSRILRLSDEGELVTLITESAEISSIAVDERAVYWTTEHPGGLYELAR